jgi:PAS domain S-box-containing protein
VIEAFERAMRAPGLPVLKWLLAFALIFATGALGFALPSWGGMLPLIILPSGVAVASMYRWGWRMWPAIFAAGLAIDLFEPMRQPLLAAIGVGIGLAGGAALSAWILRRRGFDPSFSRAKDVPLFILAAAAGMTLTPVFGYLGFFLAGVTTEASEPFNWLRWWSNTTAGVIVLAPILIAASRGSLARFTEHRARASLWLLGILICCGAMLLDLDSQVTRPPILVLGLVLTVAGAVYFGLVVAASAAFVISMMMAYCVVFHRGAFDHLSDLQGLIMIWSLSAALTGVSLIITALLAERDAEIHERLSAEHRYAQIFDGSPQPIWVHDRDDFRFLMVNEAAVRQYGWSRTELLSMRVGALIPPGETDAPFVNAGDDPVERSVEPFETRHLTRDGRLLDVEVWTRSIDCGGAPAELVFAIDVTERRAFGRALIDAIAGEQRRIGQEMHDGLGQELTGLALTARALANRAARERDAIAADLDQLALLATSCIQDARLIVQGLSPLTDADGNLEHALDSLARRSSLSGTLVRFRAQHESPLTIDLKVRNHLYRIAQEAVQNALKHSGARTIEIDLCARDGSVRLAILDNGHGLQTESASAGLGMRTMRFRASAVGGRLVISQRAGGGNSVVCEAPQARAWASTERASNDPISGSLR